MQVISGAGEFTAPAGPATTHWVEQLRVPDLSVGTYSILRGGSDDQVPHTEDEIYVITAGGARLESGRGDVDHRPWAHRGALAALVLFAPAEESRARKGG